MEKRDLKADLEFCDRAIQDAIERALKAEALARELLYAVELAGIYLEHLRGDLDTQKQAGDD